MSANIFGNCFKIISFGESHGPGMGVVIEGCPSGLNFNKKALKRFLDRRKPGSYPFSTRKEKDQFEVLSGVYQNKTLGTPIALFVRNEDSRPQDYKELEKTYRPGHADDLWKKKFSHFDPRGGGRASGRETLSRVIGGSIASMLLKKLHPRLKVIGFVSQIADFKISSHSEVKGLLSGGKKIESFFASFPDSKQTENLNSFLKEAKKNGKTYGGIAEIWVDKAPVGLGQPVFHKLKSDLSSAIMSVGATAGIEIGAGFEALQTEGSIFHNKRINLKEKKGLRTSKYGGIRGGLSTGERIILRVAIKPTSSVLDIAKKGRHDVCIVPRALPVLESMVYLVLADHVLWKRSDQL